MSARVIRVFHNLERTTNPEILCFFWDRSHRPRSLQRGAQFVVRAVKAPSSRIICVCCVWQRLGIKQRTIRLRVQSYPIQKFL